MKKGILILTSIAITSALNAQLFTDNFDSYQAGTYLGPQSATWTTWSGAEGGAEDVMISNAEANSGANSIYFSSTAANGGPQDVILEFGQQYTSGIFTFESAIFIDAGKNGYFNFQGTTTPGTTWALNCNLKNGSISIDDGATPDLALGKYTDETWFVLTIEANLTTGRWQASKDGVCFGVWENSVNQLASADLFPVQGSSFYMDDIMYDHTPYVAPALNASIIGYNIGSNIVGIPASPKVTVANTGTTAITSFDVSADINGTVLTENVTGVNLTSGQTMVVTFSGGVDLVAGSSVSSATLSNINGGVDGDPSDDDACAMLDPVVPATGKVVVGEEATGTWCPWCVRGTVFMDRFEDFGPYWAGIAVHNGDPMVVADYDAAIGGLIAGYPSALVDRGPEVDPSAMSPDFYARLVTPPTAIINNSSTWDPNTRELVVTVSADFQMAANNSYKLACVLTEDGVTGTTSDYAQANAYAGGSNGVMGGYELLPSPVPASQMVYDHVARAILPSFDGDPASFPATVNAGEIHSLTFTFTLPQEWDENEINIIGMLIAPNGTIDNAGKSKIGSDSGIDELTNASTFRMFPNPSSSVTIIEANFADNANISLRLLNMAGEVVSAKNYGQVMAGSQLPIFTEALPTGMYLVELTVDNVTMTQRLVVE